MAPLFPRSGPGESGSPMSQGLLRCYDFPPRLSGHLFASLPGSTLLRSCLATCAPGRSEVPSGPGSLFNRRPDLPGCLHVDVYGTSQVPGRSIPCLCPAPPTPAEPTIPRLLTVSSMLPPRFPRRRLQRFMNFGAQSRGLAPAAYASRMVLPPPHAKLASGWLAHLCREGVEPSGSLQKVSDQSLILLFWN